MNPLNVTPGKFEVSAIIYTSPDGFFSIAIGVGDGGHEYEEYETRFAMRWNGKTEDAKGFPLSSGHPMWFQLPSDMREVLKVLIDHSIMKVVI